jgi:hypothetical protein
MRSVTLSQAETSAACPRKVQRYRASRRVEAEARLQLRSGVERSICPECVTLAQERLGQAGLRLNSRGLRELFWVLQRVLHTTRDGADLPLRKFSSAVTGTKILKGLTKAGLIYCVDPDCWKPRDYDFRNSTARRYLPSSKLLLANAGLVVVEKAANYLEGRFLPRELTQESTVELDPASGVVVALHLVAKLEMGTGFHFDLAKVLPNLEAFSEEKRSDLLRAGQAALGCLRNPGPLHAHWSQKPMGRLYALRPALCGIPEVLRPGLKAPNSRHVGSVDFNSFEFRILCSEAGVEAPREDCAAYIADRTDLTREAVKKVLNPMLHLQTEGNLIGLEKWDVLEDRRKVERFIRTEWPILWEKIQSLKEAPDFLQRRGAQVFFEVYKEAVEREVLPAGIPMHDGWIFAAQDESQAIRVTGIFEEVGSDLLGQPVTVKCQLLN